MSLQDYMETDNNNSFSSLQSFMESEKTENKDKVVDKRPKVQELKIENKPVDVSSIQPKTNNLPEVPVVPANTLEGYVSQDYEVPTYDNRFADRPNRFVYDLNNYKNGDKTIADKAKLVRSAIKNIPTGFVSNAGKDIGDAVKGLAQLKGSGIYYGIPYTPISGRNLIRLAEGENPIDYLKSDFDENTEFFKSIPQKLEQLGRGLKENYGQNGVDLFNWDDKTKLPKINIDATGLAESFYAHPLNLLDVVGLGEVGKIPAIAKVTKGGQASKFAKNVGNKVMSPNYSKNLLYNAGERILETKPVQNIVDMIDKSPLRPATDTLVDFLNLNPDSRLLGQQGSNVRQAKLIEQANQTKNIAERNKAIEENTKNLSGLSEKEAKELVDSIESGKTLFEPKDISEARQEILNFNFDKTNRGKTIMVPDEWKNLSLRNIQDKAVEYFKKNIQGKTIMHKELGDMTSNKFTRRKYQSNAATDYRYQIGKDLEDVISNAEYITTEKAIPGKKNGFIKVHKLGTQVNISNGRKVTPVNFLIEVGEDTKGNLFYDIDKLKDEASVLNRTLPTSSMFDASTKNIITNSAEISTPRMREVKNLLRNKVNENAEYYLKEGLLDKETVNNLPVNTYAAIKNQKPIAELTDAEKLEALNDIQKMPAEQRPFYIPRMFDDKLRASDFFANSTKKYKPNELKQRKVGFGDENSTGGKRIYDPVELANRLDAHRIKLINTTNMINEVVDNFAKPFNRKTDKLMDGYVEFNPDAILKFYKGSIDLNKTTLAKLQELDNIDDAIKYALEESIKRLPEDTKEWIGVARNNNIYQIPKEVAETLGYGKNKKGAFEQLYDMGTAGFKKKVLALSPMWFINNRLGNGIMNGLVGTNLNDYKKAWTYADEFFPKELKGKSITEAEKTIIGRTGGGDNGLFAKTSRLLSGELMDTSDLKGLKKIGANVVNALGIPGKVINTIADKMFEFNNKFEATDRKAAYIHHANTVGKDMLMKKTGQNIISQKELLKEISNNPEIKAEVLKNVDNTLGDYINMTPFERRALRKVVPFYSWLRTISRYTKTLAENDPIKLDIASKLVLAGYEEKEELPEYQKGAINTGIQSEKTGKDLLLNYEHSIPFSTFGETVDNPMGIISPLITQPLEAIRGKRNFLDMPFVSPNYENVYGGGYASLDEMNKGEFTQELPIGERLGAIPLNYMRTTIPGLEATERVGLGLLDRGQPYDKLYDTVLGGYYYDEMYKNPKGYTLKEQLLKNIMPLQTVGNPKKKVKVKRKTK